MKKQLSILGVCASVLLVMCSTSNSPTGPGGGSINSETLSYSITGDSIVIISPAGIITTSTYCNGNALVTQHDTSTLDTMKTQFVLSNNNNTLILPGVDTLTRVGSGSTIQGSWTSSNGESISIGATTVTVAFTGTYADDFLAFEWASMSANYNITAAKASTNSVTLTGHVNSEVVTLTWNGVGDESYRSSNTAHAAAVVYANPTACPNDAPAWYEQFLTANAGVHKIAVPAATATWNGLFHNNKKAFARQ